MVRHPVAGSPEPSKNPKFTNAWFMGTRHTQPSPGDHTHDGKNSKLISVGGTVGPAGPTGLTGLTGPQGTAGTNGTNGTNGIDGFDGLSLLKPGAAVAETFSRTQVCNTGGTLTSGVAKFQAVAIKTGVTCSSVTFFSGGTALATPTNEWAVLFNSSNIVLARSPSNTTAWLANASKTFTFFTPVATVYSGLHYVALMIQATTTPTILTSAAQGAAISSVTPLLQGTYGSALTTPPAVGATIPALVSSQAGMYAYVS